MAEEEATTSAQRSSGEETEEGELAEEPETSADAGRLLIDEETASPQKAPSPHGNGVPDPTPPPKKIPKVELPRSHKKKKLVLDEETPKRKRKATSDESPSIADECLETRENGCNVRTVSSATESEFLGLAEPGAPICLEGCVFHEDPSGLLVVNVTWRGKSFVGTLLDSSRHDWAPPRPCDSPPPESGAGGGKGGSRTAKRAGGPFRRQLSSSSSLAGKVKKLSTAGREAAASPLTIATDDDSNDSAPGKPPQSTSSLLQPLSPVLLDCPCRHCSKRFSHPVALKYHQTAAHPSCETSCDIGSLNGSFQPLHPPTDASNGNGARAGEERPDSAYSDISEDGDRAPVLEKAALTPRKDPPATAATAAVTPNNNLVKTEVTPKPIPVIGSSYLPLASTPKAAPPPPSGPLFPGTPGFGGSPSGMFLPGPGPPFLSGFLMHPPTTPTSMMGGMGPKFGQPPISAASHFQPFHVPPHSAMVMPRPSGGPSVPFSRK